MQERSDESRVEYPILVNDDRLVFSVCLPNQPVPKGWRVSRQPQWEMVKQGYRYVPHWETGQGNGFMGKE